LAQHGSKKNKQASPATHNPPPRTPTPAQPILTCWTSSPGFWNLSPKGKTSTWKELWTWIQLCESISGCIIQVALLQQKNHNLNFYLLNLNAKCIISLKQAPNYW